MSTSEATRVREAQLYIGGEWLDTAGGRTFEDRDPYSGDVVANVAAGEREDAKRAVEAAAGAFAEWAQTPPEARQRIFLKAADLLEARSEEVVGLLARLRRASP